MAATADDAEDAARLRLATLRTGSLLVGIDVIAYGRIAMRRGVLDGHRMLVAMAAAIETHTTG